jgi:hypothetical protein
LWAYTLSGTITCPTLSLEMACIDIIVGDILPDADDTDADDETLRFFRIEVVPFSFALLVLPTMFDPQ